MPLEFTPSPRLSLGVEIELQVVDPATLDLTPAAPRLFARLGGEPHVKPELFQSMVEVCTGVCANAIEARRDLSSAVERLKEACAGEGVALAANGSHPFARHRERLVDPAERYARLIDRNAWIARRLMVFGLHVHLGMPSGDRAAQVINGLLWHLPHLLGLSASSPFWQGSDTGLASSRITIFEALPTAGHPCTFTSWGEFESLFDAMKSSRAVDSVKDIWWDVRPNPDFGTVEVRICDGLPTLTETLAVVALTHALAAKLMQTVDERGKIAPPPYWVLRENKWRASRWGLEADLVLDETGRSAPLRGELERLCRELEPIAQEQGGGSEFAGLAALMARPSYVRQRATFAREGSVEAVARSLQEEFAADRPLG
jgi:carboxylate-amine ligase